MQTLQFEGSSYKSMIYTGALTAAKLDNEINPASPTVSVRGTHWQHFSAQSALPRQCKISSYTNSTQPSRVRSNSRHNKVTHSRMPSYASLGSAIRQKCGRMRQHIRAKAKPMLASCWKSDITNRRIGRMPISDPSQSLRLNVQFKYSCYIDFKFAKSL